MATHLDGVMQGRAGRVQRQVLEGLDARRLPAALLRPLDGQHVVGELLAEHQGGGIGLGLARGVALNGEVGRLGTRRTRRRRRDKQTGQRAERRRIQVIALISRLLTQHAVN